MNMVQAKKQPIQFHFSCDNFYLPNRSQLKSFINGLFKKEGYRVKAVNYIFCTDAFLLNLNQFYLQHDTYTDIITFDFSEEERRVIADIYISVERVRENAEIFDARFLKELYRVMFHGALHLCGYKDKSQSDQGVMRSKEDYYLSLFFVPRETRSSKH